MHHAPACLFAALSVLLLGCAPHPTPSAESAPAPVVQGSATALPDWAGVYSGAVPTEGSEADLETVLHIHPDTTFTLTTRPADSGGDPETVTGRLAWEPDGRSLKLLDVDSINRPIYYGVEDDHLQQQDLITVSIEGRSSDEYRLRKDTTGLLERRWQLSTLSGEPVTDVKQPPYFVLESLDNRVRGRAGCNSLSGTYILQGQSLSFPPLITTKMACPDLELEQRFLSALDATARFEVRGGKLELIDGDGNTVASLLSDF